MMNIGELLLTSSVLILAVLALAALWPGPAEPPALLWAVAGGAAPAAGAGIAAAPTSVLNLPAARSAERFLAQQVEVIRPEEPGLRASRRQPRPRRRRPLPSGPALRRWP